MSPSELEEHVDCSVEFNKYDDDTLTLECNTHNKNLLRWACERFECDPEPPPPPEFDQIDEIDDVVSATYDLDETDQKSIEMEDEEEF